MMNFVTDHVISGIEETILSTHGFHSINKLINHFYLNLMFFFDKYKKNLLYMYREYWFVMASRNFRFIFEKTMTNY